MPNRSRSRLLAFAIAAIVLCCAVAVAPSGLTSERPASVGAPHIKSARHEMKRRKPSLGARAASIALEAVGVPYRWGGTSLTGGFDCSGLVYWAYGRLGVELPHSSYALYGEGRRVSLSRMKPGDLLFFSGLGHMGMYIGHGRMVHAPQTGRNVEVVRLGSSHYGSRLVGARRVASA